MKPDRWRATYRMPALLLLVLGLLPMATAAQYLGNTTLQEMSIIELFDLGGGPTGHKMPSGEARPAAILATREHAAVQAEALRRLRQPASAEYDHAFGVYLLEKLSPPDVDELLLALYPTLDDYGRYEALLHGYHSLDPDWAPLYAARLDAATEELQPTREAMLAAAYASFSSEPVLHTALARYLLRHPTLLDARPYASGHLEGFPYNDVASLIVSDLPALFRHALAVGESAAANAVRQPSVAELALQDSTPPVLRPAGGDGTLGGLLDILESQMPGLTFEADQTLRATVLPQTPAELPAVTLVEHLAWLCSTLKLTAFSDPVDTNRWHLAERPLFGDYRVVPTCFATAGQLFQLSAGFLDDAGGTLRLTLSMQAPQGWLNDASQLTFDLESLNIGNGTGVTVSQPPSGSAQVIQLDLGNVQPELLGRLTLRGNAAFSGPASIRIIEEELRARSTLTLIEGPATLVYQRSDSEITLGSGAAPHVGHRGGGLRAYDIGTVQLFDTDGVQRHGTSTMMVVNQPHFRTEHFRLDSGDAWQPGRLVWTFTPNLERVEIPLLFEGFVLEALPDSPP